MVSIDGAIAAPADLPEDIRVDVPAGTEAVIRATSVNVMNGADI
jgi:hypothetical protein